MQDSRIIHRSFMQPEDYTVGWICAVQTEFVAALQLFDEKHKQLKSTLENDDNAYKFGRIGDHNVVVACLPKGKYGIASAAKVATHMLRSFKSIRIGLMVGIGGGAPTLKNDVRLGDVVVGAPTGNVGGVVPYDFGKSIQNKKFELTGSLNAPPTALLAALTALHATHEVEGHRIAEHVSVITKNSRLERFKRPRPEQDRLYRTEYAHVKDGASCESCCSTSTSCLLQREPRQTGEDEPVVHYGLIASADKLMKDARIRDKLAEELHVLCFEMEAAGLMDNFPCVVIRGICDYSDSHKNDMWQGYAAAVAAAYAKELLYSIPGSQVIEQQRASDTVRKPEVAPCFNVPFDRVSQIFGRQDIMAQIEKTLKSMRTVLLAGIGGVGKSALAIEYSYRHKSENPKSHVFWGYASTHANLVQAYRDIAVHFRLPGLQDPEIDPLKLALEWLCNEESGEWLLVLDNWDDMGLFISHAKYLPIKNPKGSVIITTRDRRLGISTEKAVIHIPRLDEESAKKLILSKLPAMEEHQAKGGHQQDMNTLLTKLDYLPLAITQAISYIKINDTTIAKYIDLISSDSDFIDTLSMEHPDIRRYSDLPNSVIQTWKVSLDYIRVHSPQGTELLYLMAVLHSQSIPRRLLTEFWAEKVLIPALGTLKAFSLITQEKSDDAFGMQHLVQKATQHYLFQQREKDKYQEIAVELVYRTFPNGKHENWEICKSLYTHAEVVLQYDSSPNPLYIPMLRHKLAEYDLEQGRYDLAYKRSQRAYEELVELFGRSYPEAIDSLQLVALTLHRKGKYKEAEQRQTEVVHLRDEVIPKNQAATLTSMEELALIYWDRGKFCAAEKLHREVLKERQEFLGENHPDVLTSMDNLAQVLRDLGQYDEAELLYQRSLKGRREMQGEQHPDTLTSMKNIYGVLFSRGHYEEAAQGLQTVMQIRQMILGPCHPDTLAVLNDLGEALEYAGNYIDAEDKYRQALQGKQTVLGEKHVSTLATRNNLYRMLHKDKDFDVLEAILKKTLEEEKNILGEQHLDTITTVTDLAHVYECQGKWEQAEGEHQRALDLYDRAVGPRHPFTLMCLNNLAGLKRFCANESSAEIEIMYQRALDGRREALGDEHCDTLTSMDGLGEVLLSQGKFTEAESLFRSALLTRQKTRRPAHTDTLVSMMNLAHVLHAQRQLVEAKCLYRHVLAIKSDAQHGANKQEERDADIVECMRHLADILRQQGQYTEAEILRRTLLEWCRKDLGGESRETFRSMLNLAIVLQDGKKYVEAENLFHAALRGMEELRSKGETEDGDEDIWAFAEPLVNALRDRGLDTEADMVLHRTQLAWCRAELGNESRETLWCMRDLALVLQDAGEDVEAEGLLREALEALGGMERIGSDDDDDVWAVAEPLINLLRARGLDADANAVRERVRRRRGRGLGNWFREMIVRRFWVL